MVKGLLTVLLYHSEIINQYPLFMHLNISKSFKRHDLSVLMICLGVPFVASFSSTLSHPTHTQDRRPFISRAN